MTKREIITLAFFYTTLITIALVLILNNNKAGNISEIIQAVTGVLTLLLTVVTVIYVYKAFNEQKRQNDNNEHQITQNNYDLEYNRCLDLIYRQIELNKKAIEKFQGNINKLNGYETPNQIPYYISHLTVVISNFHRFCQIIETFLQRSILHPNDKGYLFILFSENLPPDLHLIPIRFKNHIDLLGKNIKEVRNKSRIDYISFVKSNYQKNNIGLEDKWVNDYMKKFEIEHNEEIENYLRNIQILANFSIASLDTKERVMNPNFESKIFSFKDKNNY